MDTATLLAALKTPRAEIWQRVAIMNALGYSPWPEQAAFHFDIDPDTGVERRHKLVTGGEQAGKSFSAAMEMMTKLFWGKLFWIVAPDYNQAENEFNYLESWCDQLGIIEWRNKPQKGSWQLKLITGQVVTTKSAKDVATIAGKAPDGILFVEAAQAPYEAFLRCYGRTGPSRGWLCINGTFEKDTGGWFRNLWKASQTRNKWRLKSFHIPSWSNLKNYPGGEHDPELEGFRAAMDEDHFNERFGGIPAHPKGLVHKEFDYTIHVKDIYREGMWSDWEKGGHDIFREDGVYLPIDTVDEVWVDPGYQFGYAVVFVSVFQNKAFCYDEIYVTGKNSDQVAKLAMKHPRWKQVGRIVMDVAGLRHMGGNKSSAEAWYEATKIHPVGKPVKIHDGIERTRLSLTPDPDTELPSVFFSPLCVKTCWEYAEGYKYKVDRWGEPMPGDDPEDKNNHSVKAIVYGLTHNFGPAKATQRNRARKADKVGNTRTVGGWELLYKNEAQIGVRDPSDSETVHAYVPEGTTYEHGYDARSESDDWTEFPDNW